MEALRSEKDHPPKDLPEESSDGKHNIILLDGGAGSGKVSYIMSFTAPSGAFVIWVYLGSPGLHTEKFWRAFTKMLKRWSSVFLTGLGHTGIPIQLKDIGKFTTLLNQASASAGKAILAVENFHLLDDGTVKNLIENIKNSCTVGISTVLISEQGVDISGVSRFMASRCTEQALVFTREEIKVYFTALNIVLDNETLDQLCGLTGGWAQAVYRIGKYLPRGEALLPGYIDNAVNLLYQHFFDEHYHSMRPELRQNLVLLSLLDGFTFAMALELTSITLEDCRSLYEDHQYLCYSSTHNQNHFHKLYHNFLAGMQNEVPKKSRYAFLRKAAHWYDRRGRGLDAVACYTASKEYDAIIPVLQKRAVAGYSHDEASQLTQWLGEIPQSYMDKNPLHRLYRIFAMYFAGDQQQALYLQRQLFDELERKERDETEDRVLGELHISEAYQAWSCDSAAHYRHIKAASELLPEGSVLLDVDEQHSPVSSILQFRNLLPGDLLQTKEICLKTAPYTRVVLPKIGASANFLAVAEVHMYRGEFDDAMEYANLAAAEGVRTKSWGMVAESCYALQRISMAVGELDDILAYSRQAADYFQMSPRPAPYSIDRIAAFHECAYFGLYEQLDSFAATDPLVNQNRVNHINLGRELYVHAIYMVYGLRQYHPALTFIDTACQTSRATTMFFARLKLLILKAVVYTKLERPAVALKSLMEAYRISESNEILFPFMEFGSALLDLIQGIGPRMEQDRPSEAWVKRVCEAARRYQRQREHNTLEYLRRNPHIKPRKLARLTKQEYTALKYCAMGKSTADTAWMLGVNQSTVHLYLSRAYKKLEVGGREEAVQMAIMEGILD